MLFKQLSAFLVLLQLHLLISWNKYLTNMFAVSISKYSVTFISWKSSEKELYENKSFKKSESCYVYTFKFLFFHICFWLLLENCSTITSAFLCIQFLIHHKYFILFMYTICKGREKIRTNSNNSWQNHFCLA